MLTESLMLGDLVRKGTSRVLDEELVPVDYLSRTPSKQLQDEVVLSDVVLKELLVRLMLVEVLTLADHMTRRAGRVLGEELVLSDIYSRKWILKRVLDEVIVLGDIALRMAVRTLITVLELRDLPVSRLRNVWKRRIF